MEVTGAVQETWKLIGWYGGACLWLITHTFHALMSSLGLTLGLLYVVFLQKSLNNSVIFIARYICTNILSLEYLDLSRCS